MHKLFDKLYPNDYHPYLLQRFDIIMALFLFSASLGVYLITLNPSVTAGDSGELITTVYNMGASHPPGFPLYGIIGKLFTFLRFPDIGYKMNIFSAVSAAVAVLFAYLSLVKLLGFNKPNKISIHIHVPAIAATLVFAFSKAHWSQAIMAEVYALNAALSSAMFYVMILWYEEMMTYRHEQDKLWLAPRITILLAFVMGLSITNHQIPVWYIIAWAFLLFLVLYILVSFKGKNFELQFENRKLQFGTLISVGVIAIILLLISAIKPYMLFPNLFHGQYRLIFPQHVPYILSAILIVPIWLTFVTAQLYLYKSASLKKISKEKFEALHALFWILFALIIGYGILLLNGIHGIIVSIPFFVVVIYQTINRNDLYKQHQHNWVDQFFFVLTVAMWLLVFAMSIYLYMWIRAKAIAPLVEPKPLTWGDTQTLDILFNHMLRKQYPVGSDDYSNFWGQIGALFQYHVGQFGITNTVLGFVGLAYFFKREPVQAIYFTLASLIYFWSIVDFVNFEVDPRSLETQEVFFIQQFLVASFFIGFAYQFLLDIPNLFSKKEG